MGRIKSEGDVYSGGEYHGLTFFRPNFEEEFADPVNARLGEFFGDVGVTGGRYDGYVIGVQSLENSVVRRFGFSVDV